MKKLSILALALCCSFLCRFESWAADVPLKLKGIGLLPNGLPLSPGTPALQSLVGVGTLLGKFYAEGSLQLDSFTSPTSAVFSSATPFVFIAASGDRLVGYCGRTDHGATQPGVLTLSPAAGGLVQATLVAEFVPDPDLSTGRFAGATGSILTIISTAPFTLGNTDPVSYTWIADGTIDF